MGRLEVICGPMFSGKSEELLRRLKRAQIAKRSFQLYKPVIDNRYSETHVVTHSGIDMPCRVINTAEELLATPATVKIIAIDECQFLGEDTASVIETLIQSGRRVIVAVCDVCGENATHTYRHSGTSNNKNREPAVLVGATNHYEARCRKHWQNNK